MVTTIISLVAMSSLLLPTYIDYRPDIIQLEEAIKNLPVEISEPVIEKPQYDPAACSCVIYLAQKLSLPPIRTPAELQPNTTMKTGVAILLDYKLPHIAYVEKIDNRGILVSESNFKKCAYGSRWIKFNDTSIRGFYKPSS